MAGFEVGPVEKDSFLLYARQVFAGSPGGNQIEVVSPPDSAFGTITVNDWPLLDGSGSDANTVGRVQGHHVMTTLAQPGPQNWDSNFTISFEDPRYVYYGSELMVRGSWSTEKPSSTEWAIVGGTGQLTLAQGIVRVKELSRDDDGRLLELSFYVCYCPLNIED